MTLGDITLSISFSRKYLGIMQSANFTWNDHVTTVIKKATRLIATMRKLRDSLTKNALTTIYKLYIRPILEDASTTWCNLTQTQSYRLERCQRRAARLIVGMNLFQHICNGELLSSVKLASLSSLRKLALALLGHQLYYKNAPPHLQQVTFPERVTPYSLRNTQSIALPTARTTSYRDSAWKVLDLGS